MTYYQEPIVPGVTSGFDRTFRPFREDDLTPLTLRDELQNHYLRAMVSWLLTQGWPAAKSAGSLWQIAELCIVLVEWLELVLSPIYS